MKKYWQLYLAKFDTLSLRERAMIYGAATVIVILLADAMFLGPLAQRRTAMAATLDEQREEIARVDTLLVELRQRRDMDPDAASKKRIGEIEAEIAIIDDNLSNVQTRLVPPERVPDLLRQLVLENNRLQLVSLRTLSATPLIERREDEAVPEAEIPADVEVPEAEAAAVPVPVQSVRPVVAASAEPQPAEANIFKHGVEITVRGQYADFLTYLDKLERLPWQLYWGDLRVDGDDYPRVTMTLVVYTLSLDEAWLKL